MAKETTIPFDDFKKRLPLIFDQLARGKEAVLVERDGRLYKLEPQLPTLRTADPSNIWAGYDPAKVRAALHQSAGALSGIDVEQFKREIKEQREQDSKGRPAG